jgi:hypothetical protein
MRTIRRGGDDRGRIEQTDVSQVHGSASHADNRMRCLSEREDVGMVRKHQRHSGEWFDLYQ